MDAVKLGSGDDVVTTVPYKYVDQVTPDDNTPEKESPKCEKSLEQGEGESNLVCENEITPQMIDDNEVKLKERIAQCRNIIESLKLELNQEKSKIEDQAKSSKLDENLKMENQSKYSSPRIGSPVKCTTSYYLPSSNSYFEDMSYRSRIYSDSVDSKLNYDENLVEYEKQLQKYQNTLNMAQIEKKNAIRKQMLAKAYRLKLLEVENQCNIELLRVKQSLQCLEPLQLIASKWKTNTETYNVSSYELIPRYPELIGNTNGDFNVCRSVFDNKPLENCDVSKDDCVLPD